MVMIRDIDYVADGSTMIGRLALPEGDDQRPAVLLAHEGGGLDDYQKGRAERFAELGYVAFALDSAQLHITADSGTAFDAP
jgi:dienelactone hydrolase